MSMTFYAGAERDDEIELAVDDPGYGYLFARVLADEHAGTLVAGGRLAEILNDVTAAVISNEPFPRVHSLGQLTAPQCRALLPQLQKAVVLAVAGTDRYDRVYVDPERRDDLGQLCAHCNEGSDFSDQVTISSHCMEFGHHPFGQSADARWVGQADA